MLAVFYSGGQLLTGQENGKTMHEDICFGISIYSTLRYKLGKGEEGQKVEEKASVQASPR